MTNEQTSQSNLPSFTLRWDPAAGSFQMGNSQSGTGTVPSQFIPCAPFQTAFYHAETTSNSSKRPVYNNSENKLNPRKRFYSPNGCNPQFANRPDSTQNSSLYCKNCDRRFKNKSMLDQHMSEHVKCGVEGCPYTAHYKLILQHFQLQHCSNIATKKVWQLESPEDIARWRAERKKNFPTTARIAEKAQEELEKQKCAESGSFSQKKTGPTTYSSVDSSLKSSVVEERSVSSTGTNSKSRKLERFPRFDKRQSLLEKVLSGDLKRERMFALQCIRHIVARNFYE